MPNSKKILIGDLPSRVKVLEFYRSLAKKNLTIPYSPKKVTAYHGTTEAAAKKILKSGQFIPTKQKSFPPSRFDSTLGSGAYFFLDGNKYSGAFAAAELASEKFKNQPTAVIEVEVDCQRNCDCNSPNPFFSSVEDWYHSEVSGLMDPLKTRDWFWLNYLIWTCPDIKNVETLTWDRFLVSPDFGEAQPAMCVKNMSCIKDLSLGSITNSSFRKGN